MVFFQPFKITNIDECTTVSPNGYYKVLFVKEAGDDMLYGIANNDGDLIWIDANKCTIVNE